MSTELTAAAALGAGGIDLGWTQHGGEPGLRLVRQRRAYPAGVGDGECILDLAAVGWGPSPWRRIERRRYVAAPGAGERWRWAEVSLWFAGEEDAEPGRVVVELAPEAGERRVAKIEDVIRVERLHSAGRPWQAIELLRIVASAQDGTERTAGWVVVATGHAEEGVADRFAWFERGASPEALSFARVALLEETLDAAAGDWRRRITVREPGRPAAREALVVDALDRDAGEWRRRIAVRDLGLPPEVVFYYALFAPDGRGGYRGERRWRASAMATGDHGLGDRLYGLLPAIHQRYDQPAPGGGEGPLRRLLGVFGLAADQLRGEAEGLRQRHDVWRARGDLLPHLAHWIGWQLDRTLDQRTQRREILFAPEIYQTLGTLPTVRALVYRASGWDCRVKEFVHNVFRTWAPEAARGWGIRRQRYGSGDGQPLTAGDGLDGRPAVVVDGQGRSWAFWHGDRRRAGGGGGRRGLWVRGFDAEDRYASPREALPEIPAEAPFADQEPAVVADGDRGVWLFWASDREGGWDLWARRYADLAELWAPTPGGLSDTPPERLTRHPAADRAPSAARDASGRIWLFWQSDRRGPTDVWHRVWGGAAWGSPERVTTARRRDEMPAAVSVDDGAAIWLFWSADLGDRRNLYLRIWNGGAWEPPVPVTEGRQRDEAPAVAADVFFNMPSIRLFWHSDRGGGWQIWSRWFLRPSDGRLLKSSPSRLAQDPAEGAAKEPAVVADWSERWVFWRSQPRVHCGHARTLDTADAEMMANLGTFEDTAHYTYDTGRTDDDWYAPDTVGLYLTPETEDEALVLQRRTSLESYLEPFLPANVRAVFIIEPPVYPEVYPEDSPAGSFHDEVTAETREGYAGLTEGYRDSVPGWIWIRSWSQEYRDHVSVVFRGGKSGGEPKEVDPASLRFRTWHTGLHQGE